jgi:pimeloyl-ACP methyl ester carboxylesterase
MPRRTTVVAAALILLVTACSGSTDASTATTTQTSEEEPVTSTEPTGETTTVVPVSTSPPPATPEIWTGDVAGQMIELQFLLDDTGTITGTAGSPVDEAPRTPIDGVVDDTAVNIRIPAVEAVFEGEISGDTMTGTWHQSGAEVPVTLERRDEPVVLVRPQQPVPPFPYESTDVRFDNGDVSLAGTLVIPQGDGPFPAVVLTTGSGSQDRDETLVGHKPFLVLADAFAREGIASLRFDDRGVGGSTGNAVGATTADLATDTAAAAEFLDADPRTGSIGVVGHSEGALIAPMVASELRIITFIVLLAGPGVPGSDVLLQQTEDLMRAEGASENDIAWQREWRAEIMDVAASDATAEEAAEQIRLVASAALDDPPADVTAPLDPSLADAFVGAFTDPWMRFFLAYDPAPALQALDIPVLALIGSLDLQVSAAQNIPALEDALSSNPTATVSELEGLNHLFQTATTGAVSEYATIEETFAPWAIDIVTAWILDHS